MESTLVYNTKRLTPMQLKILRVLATTEMRDHSGYTWIAHIIASTNHVDDPTPIHREIRQLDSLGFICKVDAQPRYQLTEQGETTLQAEEQAAA